MHMYGTSTQVPRGISRGKECFATLYDSETQGEKVVFGDDRVRTLQEQGKLPMKMPNGSVKKGIRCATYSMSEEPALWG